MSNERHSDFSKWDEVLHQHRLGNREGAWREHLFHIYRDLFQQWAAPPPGSKVLKTDLFDEAVSPHNLFALFAGTCDAFIGMDVSFPVAQSAERRMSKGNGCGLTTVSDVRRLSFRDESVDWVLSISTLDHFQRQEEVLTGLKELYRVLKPDGTLVITMDNPANPIIALRNYLPSKPLRALGLIPFPMGATLGEKALLPCIRQAGFIIHDHRFIVHTPRILGLWIGALLCRFNRSREWRGFFRALQLLESLEKLPTKSLTGHYVSVWAGK